MINNVVLVGRLTRNIELKHTPSGTAVTQFSLAVNRPHKSENGESQADFINCVAWRTQAENAAKFLKKGSMIGVEGRIETRDFVDNNGVKRYVTEIVVNKITFLESRKSSDPGPQEPSYFQQPQNQEQFPSAFEPTFTNPNYANQTLENQYGITDDDLPF